VRVEELPERESWPRGEGLLFSPPRHKGTKKDRIGISISVLVVMNTDQHLVLIRANP